jgi:NAD(P)-dependent dehydrogenase (short-subunit alcohol dehydrogenase family)
MDASKGRLQGRVAIITGGGAGIGEACCRLFAASGAKVVIADVNDETGKTTEDFIREAGGEGHFVHCNVSVREDVEGLVEETLRVYEAIDILVNNAGIVLVKNALDTGLDEWDNLININLRGVWLCSKQVLPVMLAAGKGSIVNIASIHGVQTLKDMTAYASSKGGVLAMTRAMALDHAPQVRVNSILPGYIATNMWDKVLATVEDPEQLTKKTIAIQPMGRLGTPLDVAYGALFFASDESAWITGASLTIDGGISARFHN